MTNTPNPTALADINAYLSRYAPKNLPAAEWAPLAPAVIPLVRDGGTQTLVRVTADMKVVGKTAVHLHRRGRELTVENLVADDTLLDLDNALERDGKSIKTREKARGTLRRLQAAHRGLPRRAPRKGDGDRIANLVGSEAVDELHELIDLAEKDGGGDARLLLEAVAIARRWRDREADSKHIAAAISKAARRFAAARGRAVTMSRRRAAVTHEVLGLDEPLGVITSRYRLSEADLDLGLTALVELDEHPSIANQAALRGN